MINAFVMKALIMHTTAKIRNMPTQSDTEKLIHVFINSRLAYHFLIRLFYKFPEKTSKHCSESTNANHLNDFYSLAPC